MGDQSQRKPKADLLIARANEVLTCIPAPGNQIGRRSGVTIAVAGEQIIAVGTPAEVAEQVDIEGAQVLDAVGKVVAPGFIDGHTHLIFGGTRAREYAARMTRGTEEVKAMGIPTGIQATVAMTRAASVDELLASASQRLGRMFRCGTTTVESKSGYGLTLENELKMLRVSRQLQLSQPVDVLSTFLGAHDFPPDCPRDRYIEIVVQEMIPCVAEEQLADFCDVYCDDGYYDVHESRRILEAGLDWGLKAKIHVDAYADIQGSFMAAELPVISADHLNFTPPAAMSALAQAGVIGVVMPALDFAVAHPRPFDARALMDAGMTLALATDLCPGCWMESMQVVLQLACRLYRFSPEDALIASTVGAARALGLDDRGSLEPGKLADIQIWDMPSFEELIYRIGNNSVETVVKRGMIFHYEEGLHDRTDR